MKTIKGFTTLLLCLCFIAFAAFPVSASGNTTRPQGQSITSPTRAEDIRWRYEEFGGHLYKRLYNYTTGEWVGDWIKC